MKSMQEILPINLLKSKRLEIENRWLNEVKTNPRFCDEHFCQSQNFISNSKKFLNKLFNIFEINTLPNFNLKELDPILKLWHEVIKEQLQLGFTIKDTAMLIFSLKKSLMSFIDDNSKESVKTLKDFNQLENLLDLMGLLTFQIYSSEQDLLINKQKSQIKYLQESKAKPYFENIIGVSQKMKAVFKAIGLVLENDITVLLEGESGTGKDVIANVIHQNSKRKDKPFITLNCGAIPKELIESELFGHEKGAFTGAFDKRIGKFELADGGTLFLDEIGDLDLALQVKLLRVLQNKEIERIGSSTKQHIDVRIIAATNQNLKNLVAEKKFRLDLYYRLNVFPINIPPLRDRTEDIIPLANHFLEKYALDPNTPIKHLSIDAENFLLQQNWEGNIRELENLIQRAVIITSSDIITATTLDFKPGEININDPKLLTAPIISNKHNFETNEIIPLDKLEQQALEHALKVTQGNVRRAAKELGISRTTFYNKAKKYNIEVINERL